MKFRRNLILSFISISIIILAIASIIFFSQNTSQAQRNITDEITSTSNIEATENTETTTEIKIHAWQAIVLGIVEGLTEYLPVSSTGHLVVSQKLMNVGTASQKEKTAADAFAICIQSGAILAVLGLYFRHVWQMLLGLFGKSPSGLKLLINIIAGFIPAAILGLTLNKLIKSYLFGIEPIIWAWLIGGIFILLWVKFWKKPNATGKKITELTWKTALIIGIFQCLAMCPGVSRSLATIIGGLLMGLNLAAAVEFSFLLGVITLGAATAKDGLEFGGLMLELYGGTNIFLGFVFAFISAAIAVKWMVSYLNKHSLSIFGYYRIVIAIIASYIFFF